MAAITSKTKAVTEAFIRGQVYAAVLEVLKKKGLTKLTIQRVAAAADIAAGTVYNYFKSKDDLLVHTAIRLFENIRTCQAEAVTAAKTPPEKLHAFLNASFTFFADNISIFNFLDQAQIYCKIDLAVKRNHVGEEIGVLTGIIEEGVKAGFFCATNAETMANFFHRTIVGTLCVNPELGEFSPEDEANSLCHLFCDILKKK